jgi:hypothetical protein
MSPWHYCTMFLVQLICKNAWPPKLHNLILNEFMFGRWWKCTATILIISFNLKSHHTFHCMHLSDWLHECLWKQDKRACTSTSIWRPFPKFAAIHISRKCINWCTGTFWSLCCTLFTSSSHNLLWVYEYTFCFLLLTTIFTYYKNVD